MLPRMATQSTTYPMTTTTCVLLRTNRTKRQKIFLPFNRTQTLVPSGNSLDTSPRRSTKWQSMKPESESGSLPIRGSHHSPSRDPIH